MNGVNCERFQGKCQNSNLTVLSNKLRVFRVSMASEKKGTSNLLTTPDNDEDDTMKTTKFDTIMDDNIVEDDEKKNMAETPTPTMKPQRSIKNECPRIKGLQSKGNFFNKTLHYKMHLPSLNTEIYRQYSDFEWLRKKLLDRFAFLVHLFLNYQIRYH